MPDHARITRPVYLRRPVAALPLMDKLKIAGGRPLTGEVRIAGAKNAALPILAAGLLSAEPLHVDNVPQLADIGTMARLLRGMGVHVERDGETVSLRAERLDNTDAPYELVKTMRASVLVLGPLVARFGRAPIAHPPGSDTRALPKRATSGPSTRTLARIVLTSS